MKLAHVAGSLVRQVPFWVGPKKPFLNQPTESLASWCPMEATHGKTRVDHSSVENTHHPTSNLLFIEEIHRNPANMS